MGCAASSNMVATDPTSNEDENELGDQAQAETMPDSIQDTDLEGMKSPLAFDVAHQDDTESESLSVIQSHPPRRLQRIEDNYPMISREEVERKQLEAEMRRREILNSRMESARLVSTRGRQRSSVAAVSKSIDRGSLRSSEQSTY